MNRNCNYAIRPPNSHGACAAIQLPSVSSTHITSHGRWCALTHYDVWRLRTSSTPYFISDITKPHSFAHQITRIASIRSSPNSTASNCWTTLVMLQTLQHLNVKYTKRICPDCPCMDVKFEVCIALTVLELSTFNNVFRASRQSWTLPTQFWPGIDLLYKVGRASYIVLSSMFVNMLRCCGLLSVSDVCGTVVLNLSCGLQTFDLS